MTADSQTRLDEYYDTIERQYRVEDAPEYATLVVPNGNGDAPVHRWFKIKEAYSIDLLDRVLKDAGLGDMTSPRILDPYAGSGTTQMAITGAVSRGDFVRPYAYGVESNPFLHLVSSTKLRAMQEPPADFEEYIEGICRDALSLKHVPEVPGLSTFHKVEYFERSDIEQLLRLRSVVEHREAQLGSTVSASLARLCIGAVVEAVSNLRRDGRALRYTAKSGKLSAFQAFREKAAEVTSDLPRAPLAVRGHVALGDGRTCSSLDGRLRPFDVVVFSPPYPNNIDYTEVYKMENWLLGYISDSDEFVEQRLATVYSHPSILRPRPLPDEELNVHENAEVSRIIAPLLDAVPEDRYAQGRVRMIQGYALDMFSTLRSCHARLDQEGRLVYVVGNSLHGRPPSDLVIAADLLMAELAEIAGFEIERIAIARLLRRRGLRSAYVRESVVFLRPRS